MPRPRRYRGTVAVFVSMTLLQAAIAAFSIQLLSSVRAYTTGESLYSKGQKDAQIYLLDYAERHDEADYLRFQQALAVPLGDRLARESLQQPVPDLAAARRGFLAGGNHPDDVDGLIRMFRWFQHVPFMSRPIQTWTEGDRVIGEMRALVERAREQILAGDRDTPDILRIRAEAPRLDEQLTRLESAFSAQLGEASRITQRLLLALNAVTALVLTGSGLVYVRRSALIQAQTQAEVEHRQESLQRLMDSAAEGVYGVDVEGRCTFVNRAALDLLGYSGEAELMGRDVNAVVHHSRSDGQPVPTGESALYRAYRTREATHSASEVLWRRDGSAFPAEFWCHPVIHDGVVQGAVVTFFDITERVEMQAALRRGQIQLERLIDAVADGVVTIDADRRIVLFNRAAERMFNTSAAAAIGSPVSRFITELVPDTLAPAAEPARPAAALRELVGTRSDGGQFPLEASLSPLDTDQGMLTTVVLRDVSALHSAAAERRRREALEAANQAKTAFLSRMSHELRTPLNAVIGFSQLLRLDPAQPLSDGQLDRVRHVETAGEHLLALVNDVLDLSRIESGEMSVSHQAVAVRAAVDEAVTMVSPLVTEVGVEVFVNSGAAGRRDLFGDPEAAGDETWVAADPLRLRQILVNLLSNAVKYNRPGGAVSITWRAEDGRCEVRVADSGPGIAPEAMAGLFEPFNRLGAEGSPVEGTGIGLVLSRQLAEMMGGTLAVASEFGAGTTAALVLPAARPPDLPQPAPPDAAGRSPPRALRVLYAEDNEVNAELVRQVVRLRPEVTLRVAESGGLAFEMASLDAPDLMLVDMNLGDMSGIDLAKLLRGDRSTRDIRLVALSADALPEQIQAAMRAGFESYMTKPIDFRELLALMDGWERETA